MTHNRPGKLDIYIYNSNKIRYYGASGKWIININGTVLTRETTNKDEPSPTDTMIPSGTKDDNLHNAPRTCRGMNHMLAHMGTRSGCNITPELAWNTGFTSIIIFPVEPCGHNLFSIRRAEPASLNETTFNSIGISSYEEQLKEDTALLLKQDPA